MKNYQEAQHRTDVSVGESVRIIRELQELVKMSYLQSPAFRNQLFSY